MNMNVCVLWKVVVVLLHLKLVRPNWMGDTSKLLIKWRRQQKDINNYSSIKIFIE